MKFRNILAIESTIGDGSVSLLLAGDAGPIEILDSGASRAEKIIGKIDDLFRKASVSKNVLDLIAVSIGPGSYSGIRIGISTAFGLGHALGVPVVGVSVLEALASSVPFQKVITVVPIGRSDVAWQIFEADSAGKKRAIADPLLAPVTTFPESLNDHPGLPVIASSNCVASVRDFAGTSRTVMEIDSSLASAIARLAEQGSLSDPKPIYMRSAVARSVG